ncbi:Maltose O-acetyltransferase [Orchesella cincta]|uniref:Maltose O-acetyltransferase n=1 Tax=Orchesella cincta TaxID=48709 RepID=A0A1D2NLB1_ORCCI|nr:Maltose O-acetyltransferase [Orchesella cincta]
MAANLPPVKPFPTLPDPKEYENLTENERMLQGFPYRPLDAELTKARSKARDLIRKYNTETSFDDDAGRRKVLDELLHPSCRQHKNIFIEPTFRCDYGVNIKLGNNFYANFDCVLLDSGWIEFGNDCMLAPGVHVYSATHPLDGGYRQLDDPGNYFELTGPVKIGNNCWLGGGAIICPGVTIGNNVIVGAGAVVTKSFPDNVVIAGNPAKVIRHMPEPTVPVGNLWKD